MSIDQFGPRGSEPVALHESYNTIDSCAFTATILLLGTIRNQPCVVHHLPKEISKSTQDLIVHGGWVSCNIIDAHYQWSSLFQGSQDIRIRVKVALELVENNVHVQVTNASGHIRVAPVDTDTTCSGRGWIGNSTWAIPLALAEHGNTYKSRDHALY